MQDDSPELEAAEVISLWDSWFADARVAWVQGDVTSDQFDYYGDLTKNPQYVQWTDSYHCGNGRVVSVDDFEFPENTGRLGWYEISHSPANPWNKITLSFFRSDPVNSTSFFTTSLDVDGEFPYQVFPGPKTWVVVAEPDVEIR